MNKNILLTIAVLCFYLVSYAQIVDYVPFPIDTAKWTETVTLQGMEPGMPYTEEGVDYYILGDTIVNQYTYQKVYSKHSFRVVDYSGFFRYRPLNLIGGIREDSTKKVYFLYLTNIVPAWNNAFHHFTKGEEYLLYDFDIEVGDTVAWMLPEPFILDSVTNVVRRIDTIELYENHYRRKFIFSDSLYWYTADIYWISGIGSSQGLFGPYRQNTGDVNDPRLVCFNNNTNSILLEGKTRFEEARSCDFLYNEYLFQEPKEEEEEEEEEGINSLSDLNIYPNPFNGELKIAIPKDVKVTIAIYDISLKEIYKEEFENTLIDIKLPNLLPGIYLLKTSGDGKEEIRKIVKI